ncbi:hypothetical protein CP8484711_0924A, partial [Chlamydia psittaci 84-8471/1]
MLCGRCTQRE